jgi:hypothetical protein
MKTARLTIKNYRGFSDQTPACVEVGEGLTALLGPNNAGKSSLKLFIYEMRALFDVLRRGPARSPQIIGGSPIGVGGYPGTSDVAEIFNNSNDRDLTFEIEVVDPTLRPGSSHTINRLVGTCQRSSPLQWSFRFCSLQSGSSPAHSGTGYTPIDQYRFRSGNGQTVYDFEDMLEILEAFFGARYYGAFRNALNQGSSQHYDFQIGTAFIDLWNNWKSSLTPPALSNRLIFI